MLAKPLPFGGSKGAFFFFFQFLGRQHFLTTSYNVSMLPPGSHPFLSAVTSPDFLQGHL